MTSNVPRCRYCNEETGGTPTSSHYGSVHKWGPTTHKFTPRKVQGSHALDCDRRANEGAPCSCWRARL